VSRLQPVLTDLVKEVESMRRQLDPNEPNSFAIKVMKELSDIHDCLSKLYDVTRKRLPQPKTQSKTKR